MRNPDSHVSQTQKLLRYHSNLSSFARLDILNVWYRVSRISSFFRLWSGFVSLHLLYVISCWKNDPTCNPHRPNLHFAYVEQSSVSICWKVPSKRTATIKDYRLLIAEAMFRNILNTRFYKVSKQKNPPFFSCRVGSGEMARPMSYYEVEATCPERGTLQALEQMLIEVSNLSW